MGMDISVEIKRYLRTLKALGINGISKEIEALAERSLLMRSEEAAEVWDITTTILSYTGIGQFDSAMRRWSPSSGHSVQFRYGSA